MFSKKSACVFAALLAADRAVKLWALTYLDSGGSRFFALHFNLGVSFSMLSGYAGLSLLISAAAVVILGSACVMSSALRGAPGMAFVWAGAIGNLTDRLAYGYVVDWLPVAGVYVNLADVWLCLGCLRICLHYMTRR